MTVLSMEIRFIAFIGHNKKAAELNFDSGLNLVFGPSNSGKSSVLDAIDFMFGRERVLKEIPEHEGYDQVLLGVEFSNKSKFTFIRNINGGDFEYFDGLHKEKPDDQEGTILRPRTATKKIESISNFILERLDLNEKKLKKNADNKVIRLTLRNFLPIAMITEAAIQKEESPYISQQYIEKTLHRSRLKLLLTGVDDSSLLPSEVEKKRLSRTAQIDILDELIFEQQEYMSVNLNEDETLEELESQEEKIIETIENDISLLETSEEQYNLFISNRTNFRNELEQNNERLSEISEMIIRFDLLKTQYQSDILRLENISETGTLIAALPSSACPLCGGDTSEINNHKECDGNLADVVSAATSEKKKLENLHTDLLKTINQLILETESIEKLIPEISKKLSSVNEELSELNPELVSQRYKYTELLAVKTHVQKSIEMFSHLDVLQQKKEKLEKEAPEKIKSSGNETSLPTKALFNLSLSVKNLLQEWNFQNSENIHFDKETGDFVIDGKHRVSNGKGHRAITHAAATLGLMKYTEDNGLPHLGFSILDSPLLAYEEPENEADDLRGTDVNVKFLDSLSAWNTRQIIVFENKKSIPEKYMHGDQIVSFTKGKNGRYGFFPTDNNRET